MKPYIALALVVVGCGSAPDEPLDGGSGPIDDASTDAQTIVPPEDDASIDPGTFDAGSEPTVDAGGNTTVDAGPIDPAPIDAGPIDPAPIDAGPVDTGSRSAGCGLGSGTGDFRARTITVRGRARTYHILVPRTYDPSRAYPIIFKWHGWGGNGLSGGIGVEYFSLEDAIVVSADAIDGTWDLSSTGVDAELFDLMLAEVSAQHCVDLDRVFSYGFSRGGGMTSMLACTRPGVIRATAAVAGLEPWVGACAGPVAAWMIHDSSDDSVPIDQGIRTRDRFLAVNGCSASNTPVDPSPCVQYTGCSTPVVWCQTSGRGHDIRADIAPSAVWSFFSSLP